MARLACEAGMSVPATRVVLMPLCDWGRSSFLYRLPRRERGNPLPPKPAARPRQTRRFWSRQPRFHAMLQRFARPRVHLSRKAVGTVLIALLAVNIAEQSPASELRRTATVKIVQQARQSIVNI